MPQSQACPIRVLIIDDQAIPCAGLRRLIESQPAMTVVGEARDSTDALSIATREQPDIILLDLDLGGESGINAIPDFLAKSKARVLILTGVRDPAKHDSAVLAGACGVVTKEDTAETILKAIEKAYLGELWLDRAATGRIFVELSKRNSADKKDPNQLKISALTARERQIVIEMASDAGATTRSVAEKMCISEHTLRNHLTSIYDKLGVSSRLELWAYANKHGLTKLSA